MMLYQQPLAGFLLTEYIMDNYTKLYKSLITSTIWREDNCTRILWITMLAVSDADGNVEGSIPGIAHLAGISIGECETSLKTLMAPDPYSRTKDHEGKRISEVDGGGIILNRAKYRDKKAERTEYMRNYMRKRRQDVNNPVSNVNLTLAQKEKEKEKEKKNIYMQFVKLTDEEHQKLVESFGEAGTGERISALNEYIGSKGTRYKSHYYTILAWDRRKSKTDTPEPNYLPQPVTAFEKQLNAEKKRKLEQSNV